MSLFIRTAGPPDGALIHRFVTLLARYEREPDAVEATPEVYAQQMGGPNPPFECRLAFWSEEPAGFALFFHNYSTWRGRRGLYLEDLFVLPELRGLGIGKALFVDLARIAVQRDCARMEWSVLDWNQPAIDFYQTLGAGPLDEWTTFRLTGDALTSLGGLGPERTP